MGFKFCVPLPIKEAMVTSSSIAEPDTTIGETAWSSSEYVAASAERIIAAPSSAVTLTNASPCVVTWADNGLAVDAEVTLTTSGSLPTGLVVGTRYFVAARLTSSTFTLKDIDGRTINTTSAGSGTHTMTAKVHKVYQSAVGGSNTVTAVDTGNETLQVVAHGFVADQPVIFTSTGTVPPNLVAGTTYYTRTITSVDLFTVSAVSGVGPNINLTGAGSGTITVHYGTATLGPNFNKPPAITAAYWTEVSPTNKWAMVDGLVNASSEAASSIATTIVPGSEFNTVAVVGKANLTAATLRHEINRKTCTFDAGTDRATATSHGFAADTPIAFTNSGGALPTELVSGTTYYVKSPAANDFQISATAGGAAINLTGAGTGTHTVGQVNYSAALDHTAPVPAEFAVVSAANQATAAYYNGTLFLTLTGTNVGCSEVVVGLTTDIGTTVNDIWTRIKNYSPITRDDFGNPTITRRGYTKLLRCNVTVQDSVDDVDEVNALLAEHKDDIVLLQATNAFQNHTIYGIVTSSEMSSDSTVYQLLQIEAEGLIAT